MFYSHREQKETEWKTDDTKYSSIALLALGLAVHDMGNNYQDLKEDSTLYTPLSPPLQGEGLKEETITQ
jgi:hypothetical protein